MSFDANVKMPGPRVTAVSSIVAFLLLALNFVGLFVPMRAPEIDGYRDFAGAPTLPYEEALDRLRRIASEQSSRVRLVEEATELFHHGLAHVDPDDVQSNGLEHYGMRVPVTENWVLFLLSYVKPDTYRDYEFCSHRRALERGTGRCGQQSLALVSFLSEHGIRTGFVALGGHAIATAEVADDEWYLLDADYGGVIPFDLATAEREPSSVLEHYWNPAARERNLDLLYEADQNSVSYGGPRARYARACPIENAAYVLKWAIPVLLLVPLAALPLRTRRFR